MPCMVPDDQGRRQGGGQGLAPNAPVALLSKVEFISAIVCGKTVGPLITTCPSNDQNPASAATDDDDHLPPLFQLPGDKLLPNVSVGRSTAPPLSISKFCLLTSDLCVPTKIQTPDLASAPRCQPWVLIPGRPIGTAPGHRTVDEPAVVVDVGWFGT